MLEYFWLLLKQNIFLGPAEAQEKKLLYFTIKLLDQIPDTHGKLWRHYLTTLCVCERKYWKMIFFSILRFFNRFHFPWSWHLRQFVVREKKCFTCKQINIDPLPCLSLSFSLTHIHKHTPTHALTHKCTHTHARTSTHPHACTHELTHTCTHTHMHSHTNAHARTCTHIHTYTFTCTTCAHKCRNTHPHIHIYTYMHTHTRS